MLIGARLILMLLVSSVAVSALAALTADYQFQGTLTSTVAGAPALTNVGNGINTFTTDTPAGISRTVLTFPQGNGVALSPTTSLTPSNTYTIVIFARLTDVIGYRRYVDLMNQTSDNGLYNLDGDLHFFNSAIGTGAPISAGTYSQIVLTRDGVSGTVIGYVEGVQQFSFVDGAGDGIISAANTLRFFVDDSVVPGEESAGAVARIRIYDTVLTPAQVAALDTVPAISVTEVPTLAPMALPALALLLTLTAWAAIRTTR